jgi:hypothetical protein
MGLIAGSNTDPPALAYSNQATNSDARQWVTQPYILYRCSTYLERTNDFVTDDVMSI